MNFERIKKLQNKINSPYFTMDSAELVYLCGYTGSYAGLLILRHDFYFFTDSRYFSEYEKIFNDKIILIKRSIFEGLQKVYEKLKFDKILINAKKITYENYMEIKKRLPDLEINVDNASVDSLRSIKTKQEVMSIKKAIKIAEDAFIYILTFLKEGVSEKDVVVELEHTLRLKGADNPAFPSIVLFGERGACPHGKPSNEVKLKNGDVVLIDMGANVDNYNSDMTRTFCFGKIPDDFKKVYNIVLDAQKKAFDVIYNGISAVKVDEAARNYIAENSYGECFGHGLGHGIGVEVHEAPRLSPFSKDNLETGMVFSNEPGVYIPGKFGIRIEDLIVLRNKGPEWLTGLAKQKVICV